MIAYNYYCILIVICAIIHFFIRLLSVWVVSLCNMTDDTGPNSLLTCTLSSADILTVEWLYFRVYVYWRVVVYMIVCLFVCLCFFVVCCLFVCLLVCLFVVILVFLNSYGRHYHLTQVNRWSDCVGYRIEIVYFVLKKYNLSRSLWIDKDNFNRWHLLF